VDRDSPITTARASYDSIKGVISVNWRKSYKSYVMNVGIPSTTLARVIVPKHDYPYSTLQINGHPIADWRTGYYSPQTQSLGIDALKLRDDGSIEMSVQPGEYSFLATI